MTHPINIRQGTASDCPVVFEVMQAAFAEYKDWLVPQSGFTGKGRLGEGSPDSPLNRAAKGVVPVVMYPNGEFKSDSTPIMLEL